METWFFITPVGSASQKSWPSRRRLLGMEVGHRMLDAAITFVSLEGFEAERRPQFRACFLSLYTQFFFFFFFPFEGRTRSTWKFPGQGLNCPATVTAIATWDPSLHICDLHHSSQHPLRHCWIPDPLSEAKDQTCILMDTSWIHFPLLHDRNSLHTILRSFILFWQPIVNLKWKI